MKITFVVSEKYEEKKNQTILLDSQQWLIHKSEHNLY